MLKSLFQTTSKEPSSYRVFLWKLLILLAFALGLWFAYSILHVILAFAFSAFLVMLFSPFLNWCNRHRIANWLGIIIIYIILLGLITLIFVSIVPIFVNQISQLIHAIASWFNLIEQSYKANGVSALGLPDFITNYIKDLDWKDLFAFLRSNIWSIGTTISGNLKNIASGWAGVISSVSNIIFSIATTFVFTFFMAIERKNVYALFYDILPKKLSDYLAHREVDIMNRLSSWIKWQLILSVSISLLVYIGLWILHTFGIVIENKATLALLAGLLESVPYFGPFLAVLPALALAGSVSWIAVIVVLFLYIWIQQLEGQVLVPLIMSKSLDLSPLFVLVMMAIGISTAGVLGILLAVPVAAIIEIGVRDFLEYKKKMKL